MLLFLLCLHPHFALLEAALPPPLLTNPPSLLRMIQLEWKPSCLHGAAEPLENK